MGMCKCSNGVRLCPVSLGIALGATCGLGVLVWTAWAMYIGSLPVMASYMSPAANWSEAGIRALWALGKGFICGFTIALIYDLIASFCKGSSCKNTGGGCGCGCACSKSTS